MFRIRKKYATVRQKRKQESRVGYCNKATEND
jgi:hypothetical protein